MNRTFTLWECPARCITMARVNYQLPLDRKKAQATHSTPTTTTTTTTPTPTTTTTPTPPSIISDIKCHNCQLRYDVALSTRSPRFIWPTWGPPGCWRPKVGPMLAPWILLSGYAILPYTINVYRKCRYSLCLKVLHFTPVFHSSVTWVWIITASAFYGVFILVLTLEYNVYNERNISGYRGCCVETSNI